MKKLLIPFFLIAIICMMGSCSSIKQIAYFQNIDSISLAASKGLYDAKIMPKDELTITVQTTKPEVSAPFNLTINNRLGNAGQMSSGGGYLQGYLVDNDGNINFPIVGKLHVAGMTKTECEEMIKGKVTPYLAKTEKPIVTVRTSSYRVTVIGEVGGPRVVPVTTEKMSIIEALAQAGDLSIYGKRDNVLLIREDSTGEKHEHRLNLKDANIFNSPYYYLQQNDIVYVQPNNVKANNSVIGSSTTLWFSFLGVITSLASLIITIVR